VRVVECIDRVADGRRRGGPRRVGFMVDEFAFERGEETLGDGVVPAISSSAHARDDAARPERGPVIVAGVRTAEVGMVQKSASWSAGRESAFQCIERELAVVLLAGGPAHHAPRAEVQNDGQVECPQNRGRFTRRSETRRGRRDGLDVLGRERRLSEYRTEPSYGAMRFSWSNRSTNSFFRFRAYAAEGVCFESHVVARQNALHESIELSACFDSAWHALRGADRGAQGGGDRSIFGIERMYYGKVRRRAVCGHCDRRRHRYGPRGNALFPSQPRSYRRQRRVHGQLVSAAVLERRRTAMIAAGSRRVDAPSGAPRLAGLAGLRADDHQRGARRHPGHFAAGRRPHDPLEPAGPAS
jgi:hypothetical protein